MVHRSPGTSWTPRFDEQRGMWFWVIHKRTASRLVVISGTVALHQPIGFVCIWLVVWLPFLAFSHEYWEFHHPNWRTHIFQRGGPTTNQVCIGILMVSLICHQQKPLFHVSHLDTIWIRIRHGQWHIKKEREDRTSRMQWLRCFLWMCRCWKTLAPSTGC